MANNPAAKSTGPDRPSRPKTTGNAPIATPTAASSTDGGSLRRIASGWLIPTATRKPAQIGLDEIAPYIAYGASPRGPISVVAAARALAVLRGRDYVLPADVQAVVRDAFRHRLVLSYQALAEEVSADQVLDSVLARIQPPAIDLGRPAPAAA